MEPERFSPLTAANTTFPYNQLPPHHPQQQQQQQRPVPLSWPGPIAAPSTGQQAYLNLVHHDPSGSSFGALNAQYGVGPQLNGQGRGVVRPPKMPELYDPQRNQPLSSGSSMHIGPPQPPPVQTSILEQPLIPMDFDIPPSFPYHGRKLEIPLGQVKEGVDPSWLDAEGRNEDLSSCIQADMEFLNLSPLPTAAPPPDHHRTPRIPISPLLQPGAGLSATADLCLAILKLEGGTYDDYAGLAEAHFDEDGRFQLQLPAPASPILYDIPASSLARFFDTLVSNHLTRHILCLPALTESVLWAAPESPMSITDEPPPPINSHPRHGIRVDCEDMIWTIGSDLGGHVKWRGRLSAVWIPAIEEGALRLETLEVEVEDWSQTGKVGCVIDDGMPETVHRVLQLAMEIEEMENIIQLSQQEGIPPNEALGIVTESIVPDQVRIVGEDGEQADEHDHEMS